jgi:hypothetical protein
VDLKAYFSGIGMQISAPNRRCDIPLAVSRIFILLTLCVVEGLEGEAKLGFRFLVLQRLLRVTPIIVELEVQMVQIGLRDPPSMFTLLLEARLGQYI